MCNSEKLCTKYKSNENLFEKSEGFVIALYEK